MALVPCVSAPCCTDCLAWKLPTSADIPPFGRGHPSPNRYKDILPTPSTRYHLKKLGGDNATTYINANWVKGEAEWPKVNYIAAQGPTTKTVPSFVRMIWESGCEIVVMTTNLIEGAKAKCERYWPDTGNKAFSYGQAPPITLRAGPKSNHNGYIKQELTMSCGGTQRTLVHFWYNTWPDHGVPKDQATGELNCTHILEMLGDVRRYGKTCVNQDAPIIVHCSAGIGRTGTYMGIDICSKLLWKQGTVCPYPATHYRACLPDYVAAQYRMQGGGCRLCEHVRTALRKTSARGDVGFIPHGVALHADTSGVLRDNIRDTGVPHHSHSHAHTTLRSAVTITNFVVDVSFGCLPVRLCA